MRKSLQSERGTAIVLAIVLMTMMIAVGLAAYSFVDTQQVETMRERQRESSFNLAEAALNSQSFVLSRRWAGAASSYAGTTPTCSNSTGVAAQCPDPAHRGGGQQHRQRRWGLAGQGIPEGQPALVGLQHPDHFHLHGREGGELRVRYLKRR